MGCRQDGQEVDFMATGCLDDTCNYSLPACRFARKWRVGLLLEGFCNIIIR
jgi:hypothetical protein